MSEGARGGEPRRRGAQSSSARRGNGRGPRERYAGLDLGTNNCRLLVAAPQGRELRIVDAYSRIVRLGEGLAASGVLSKAAMDRAVAAIAACAEKMRKRGVTHSRCIATQACRAAANGEDFLARVREETGLEFEIIAPEEEARLAVAGCANLLDLGADAALIFDIGGGSTELSWLKRGEDGVFELAAWTSLPTGVVSLAEEWDGRDITADAYAGIVAHVRRQLAAFGDPAGLRAHFEYGGAHLLGTSGTITSVAGVHLALPRYRRDLVDGLWLGADEALAVAAALRAKSFEERAREPCIGRERADLVVCGCAILEAVLAEWPTTRIRVADRGLREGMLTELAAKARKERKRRRAARAHRDPHTE